MKFHVIPAGERLFIDLLPENWSGLLPGLPQEVIDELARRAGEADKLIGQARLADQKALADPIRVKVATQPTFSRYVFDLPTTTHVDPERGEGTYTLHFDQPIKWDLADALSALPSTVQTIDTVRMNRSAAVHFKLHDDPQVRTFRNGRSFVVDIGHADCHAEAGACCRRRADGGDRAGRAGDRAAADRAGASDEAGHAARFGAGRRRRAADGRHGRAGCAAGQQAGTAAVAADHGAEAGSRSGQTAAGQESRRGAARHGRAVGAKTGDARAGHGEAGPAQTGNGQT